ncbi:hypothetical protein [Sporomusa malonica]|uniref:Uncharacterized protein n=1 Tax=Sporomusa malonica TaxID=112901 RepID=A0A1W1ZB12_9FIRM|nr:hypothetical protein [Sporomusa malonica]SMC45614.1 hypothetical protein SAMN04488500_103154 [Sporomusa malonica]
MNMRKGPYSRLFPAVWTFLSRFVFPVITDNHEDHMFGRTPL